MPDRDQKCTEMAKQCCIEYKLVNMADFRGLPRLAAKSTISSTNSMNCIYRDRGQQKSFFRRTYSRNIAKGTPLLFTFRLRLFGITMKTIFIFLQ